MGQTRGAPPPRTCERRERGPAFVGRVLASDPGDVRVEARLLDGAEQFRLHAGFARHHERRLAGPCVDPVDLAEPGSGGRLDGRPVLCCEPAPAELRLGLVLRGANRPRIDRRRRALAASRVLVVGASRLAQSRERCLGDGAIRSACAFASSTAARCAAHGSTASAWAAPGPRPRAAARIGSRAARASTPDRPERTFSLAAREATTSSCPRAISKARSGVASVAARPPEGPVEIVRRTSRLAAGRARMISMRAPPASTPSARPPARKTNSLGLTGRSSD